MKSFLTIALLASISLPALSQEKKPVEVKWNAEKDMQALQRKWKVSEVNDFVKPKLSSEFGKALLTKDSVFQFEKGEFAIVETKLKGTASNSANKIDLIPQIWSNSEEPILEIKFATGEKDTISYVIHDKTIRVRYPARSCSRSGCIITLKKLED